MVIHTFFPGRLSLILKLYTAFSISYRRVLAIFFFFLKLQCKVPESLGRQSLARLSTGRSLHSFWHFPMIMGLITLIAWNGNRLKTKKAL
jgi:hypothetical protein